MLGLATQKRFIHSFIHSFIYSDHFYSASSSPQLLRGASDTSRILCRSFTLKSHRQLQVKELPKVPSGRLERDSNPQPFGQKASTLPIGHHAPPNGSRGAVKEAFHLSLDAFLLSCHF